MKLVKFQDRKPGLVNDNFVESALQKNQFYSFDSHAFPQYGDTEDDAFFDSDGYYVKKYLFEPDNLKRDDDDFIYRMNSSGFRTKHFKQLDKNKKTIVFSGCSITSGAALESGLYWPDMFMSKLNDASYDSYNLALNGGSVFTTVHNFRSFVDQYGVPEYFIALMPDFERNIVYSDESEEMLKITLIPPDHPAFKLSHVQKFMTGYSVEDLVFSSITDIYMLETLCKALGTTLIWSTWDWSSAELCDKLSFNNYISVPNRGHVEGIPTKNINNIPRWDAARDNAHPGSKYHDVLSNIFLEHFRNSV